MVAKQLAHIRAHVLAAVQRGRHGTARAGTPGDPDPDSDVEPALAGAARDRPHRCHVRADVRQHRSAAHHDRGPSVLRLPRRRRDRGHGGVRAPAHAGGRCGNGGGPRLGAGAQASSGRLAVGVSLGIADLAGVLVGRQPGRPDTQLTLDVVGVVEEAGAQAQAAAADAARQLVAQPVQF